MITSHPPTSPPIGEPSRDGAHTHRRAAALLAGLLLFFPGAVVIEVVAPDWHLLAFTSSCIAILPLVAAIVHATEQLASRMGAATGGLLNATFSNAAELIILVGALRAGLYNVVEAAIAGSIIANTLLVLGTAMLAGGVRYEEQHFNPTGARSRATMLSLAAIALIVPAAFAATAGPTTAALQQLSFSMSLVLLTLYALFLAFALVSHPDLFVGEHAADDEPAAAARIAWADHRSHGPRAGSQ